MMDFDEYDDNPRYRKVIDRAVPMPALTPKTVAPQRSVASRRAAVKSQPRDYHGRFAEKPMARQGEVTGPTTLKKINKPKAVAQPHIAYTAKKSLPKGKRKKKRKSIFARTFIGRIFAVCSGRFGRWQRRQRRKRLEQGRGNEEWRGSLARYNHLNDRVWGGESSSEEIEESTSLFYQLKDAGYL